MLLIPKKDFRKAGCDHLQHQWFMFLVLYIGSVAASINQFKVPPLMDRIVQDLGFSMSTAGLLMSFFALASFLLALPAGMLIRTRHLRKLSIIGLAALTAGGVLGAVSKGPLFMLMGRALEGVGIISMGMAGPTLISLWFQPDDRSFPMGIWSSWMPAGSILMFNLAYPLGMLGGWRTIWWFVAFFSGVALLLFIKFIHLPEEPKESEKNEWKEQDWRRTFRILLTNKNLCLLSFMFIAYNFVLSSYYSWVSVYLQEVLGISPTMTAFTVSLIHLGIIPTTIGVGWVIKMHKNYRNVYIIGFISFTLILMKSFQLNPSITMIYMFSLGALSGSIPAAIFAATPEVIGNKRDMPFASSAILWGQNVGVLLGASCVGRLLSMGVTWEKVTYLLVSASMAGLIAALLTRVEKDSKGIALEHKG